MNRLIKIIEKEQRPDGSFSSWSAPLSKWRGGKITVTSFFTSVMLATLGGFKKDKPTGLMLGKACHFLISQKSADWTWNYWQKGTRESKQFTVPDDLDDTFCAASALHLHHPKKIPPTGMAQLIKLLTRQEAAVGGPYKTWVVPANFSKQWRDADLAVNSNIAYFLSLQGVELKNISKLIDQAIAKKSYGSPYYPTIYPVLYFISRAYKGNNKKQIQKFIWSKRRHGQWDNPQDTALAVSALLNLGAEAHEVQNSIKYLVSLPYKDIKAYPFCADPQQKGKKFAAGSKALTAGLMLEALNKYGEATKAKDTTAEKFYLSIINQISKDTLKLGVTLRQVVEKWIHAVLESDQGHKIILISYWAGNAKPKITRLASLATFYGWMAYLLQDKMLDGEAGAELIPAANYFNTHLNSIVVRLEREGVQASRLLSKLCQTMDEANFFELNNFKLGSLDSAIKLPKLPAKYLHHKLLAAKSIGFAFGPTLVSKNLGQFFHHYLIARQLNDDAHDWEDDLATGRLNSVSIMLIAKWQKLHPGKPLTRASAAGSLRPIFVDSVLGAVAKQIQSHCNKALEENRKLSMLIAPLANAANQAIAQQQQARALLKLFKK